MLVVIGLLFALSPTRADAHPGSGIVVGADGAIYFVVYGTNRIMRIAPDGRRAVLVDDERLRLPHHLVVDATGALYSSSDFDGKVWRIGTDGSLTLHFDSAVLPRSAPGFRGFAVGLGGDPFTIGPDGALYALGPDDGASIVRIERDGKFRRLAGGAPFGELHFGTMVFGPTGALHVTDRDRVWRIEGDSARALRPRDSALERATGLAFDRDGNLLVADYERRRVIRFAPDGAVNTPRALARLRLTRPVGVAVRGDTILVLDNPSGVIVWRVVGESSERLYTERETTARLGLAVVLLVAALFVTHTWTRRPRRWLDWAFWIGATLVVFVGLYGIRSPDPLFVLGRHVLAVGFLAGAWWSQRALPRRGTPPPTP